MNRADIRLAQGEGIQFQTYSGGQRTEARGRGGPAEPPSEPEPTRFREFQQAAEGGAEAPTRTLAPLDTATEPVRHYDAQPQAARDAETGAIVQGFGATRLIQAERGAREEAS